MEKELIEYRFGDREMYPGCEMRQRENLKSEEDREGKRATGQFEDVENDESVKTLEVYNRDKPPKDDCCPICLDDFRFPCRTSCGHWFCASCILKYWRYSVDFICRCKCPKCFRLINNLVPEVSVQPGDEVGEILKNIQQYNRLRSGGWSVFLWKALAIAKMVREWSNPPKIILLSMHLIGRLMCLYIEHYDLDFFPYGALGVTLYAIGSIGFTLYMMWTDDGRGDA